MARIAIGGFQHETNTFAPTKAGYDAFTTPGAWPGQLYGAEILEEMVGRNISIAGFIEAAKGHGHELVPTTWAAAAPSAAVTRDAYERIAGELVTRLKAALPVDAVYLCLHGAMVAEHLEDGEGELLSRVRAVVGPQVPVVASLDLHANTTPEMVRSATAMIGYRTYPHIDMAETGQACARFLHDLLGGSGMTGKAFRQQPFLIPLTFQCTMTEPAAGLYAAMAAIERETGAVLTFNPGFPAADIAHCGPAVIGYARSDAAAAAAVDRMAALVEAAEADFAGKIYAPDEGVLEAMRLSRGAGRPVVIADTQDNPGAGGDSNTTGMLKALLDCRAANAAFGLLVDPEAAKAAHQAGVGAEITLDLAGRSGVPGDAPLRGTFRVGALSDGRFEATGPFYKGSQMRLGLSARLEIGGVEIALGSSKVQMADQAMYRFVGIEPTAKSILVNKSSVHFRADFTPIAHAILVAAAPGPMIADPSLMPWTRLRKGVRTKPMGTAF